MRNTVFTPFTSEGKKPILRTYKVVHVAYIKTEGREDLVAGMHKGFL
jgi:hypothetical protein